jgi:hypothetical protein
MKTKPLILTATLLLGLTEAPRTLGVILGQTDTFEDGTTQGWVVGLLGAAHPAPPVNIPTGGPAGADDNFLLLTSVGGTGPGSRLSVINFAAQWAGDYLAADVGVIQMDLRNFGGSDLTLRLLIANPLGGPPTDFAFSTVPRLLPAGGGWTRVAFPIAPTDLTAGLGDVNAALTTATELRLYHSVDPAFPGGEIVAQLGVDNIRALVPEASTATQAVVLGLTALGMGFLRRRPRQ